MRSFNPWPLFPNQLEPEAKCSLSLQFLIQEVVISFDLVALLIREGHRELDAILHQLAKFLIFSIENPLSQKGGALDRLCFYSEILLQNSSVDEEIAIPALLEKMRSQVLELRSQIAVCQKKHSGLREISQNWVQLLKGFQLHLKEIFDSLFPFLREFYKDENVLFLLIEQKEKINQHIGVRSVENILSSLFPQGLSALKTALYDGYKRRGFLDFYSQNEQLVEYLDWEDLCPSTSLKH